MKNLKKIFAIFFITINFQNILSMQTIKNIFFGFEEAIKNGNIETIEKNYLNNIKQEHLHLAIKYNQLEVMKLLLTQKKYTENNFLENTVPQIVLETLINNNLEMTHLILKNTSIKYDTGEFKSYVESYWPKTGKFFSNIIKHVLQNDDIETFKIFMETQKNSIYDSIYHERSYWDKKTDRGVQSIFAFAIIFNAKKIIKYILKNQSININTYCSIDLNTIYKDSSYEKHKIKSYNYLGLASLIGDKEIIKLFVNHKNTNIREAHLWLIENNYSIDDSIIKIFQNKSFKKTNTKIEEIIKDINILPTNIYPKTLYENGNNILHLALKQKNYKLYKNIVKENSYLNYEFNYDSESPLDILSNKFIKFITMKRFEALKELMLKIRFTNIKDSHGDTLLHHAIRSGNKKIIKLILFFAPHLVFVKNKAKNTPIHLASNKPDILKFLINGACKN